MIFLGNESLTFFTTFPARVILNLIIISHTLYSFKFNAMDLVMREYKTWKERRDAVAKVQDLMLTARISLRAACSQLGYCHNTVCNWRQTLNSMNGEVPLKKRTLNAGPARLQLSSTSGWNSF